MIVKVDFSELSLDEKKSILRYVQDEPLLREMVTDDDHTIRYIIAGNIHAPVDVLEKLALDDDPRIIGVAMSNPRLPNSIRKNYLSSDSLAIRRGIASSPCIDDDIICYLLNDEDWKVVADLLGNPQIKSNHIELIFKRIKRFLKSGLCKDKSKEISIMVVRTTCSTCAGIRTMYYSNYRAIAKCLVKMAANKKTPPYILKELHKNGYEIAAINQNDSPNVG